LLFFATHYAALHHTNTLKRVNFRSNPKQNLKKNECQRAFAILLI
jgi:hypothetical protein